MVVPFFIENLYNLIPKIHFTYINHDKPKKMSREGYIKNVHTNEWQVLPSGYDLRSQQPYYSTEYHQSVCTKYYLVETLDGSEYHLCQHGAHIK